MHSNRIYLSPPFQTGKELSSIKEMLAENWLAPAGPWLTKFEKQLVNYTKTNSALTLNSGTAAIHLALILLNIGYGDEVICPTLTFAATANPILYVGAKPIFVDSELDTLNICPEILRYTIENRIRITGKKPAAIIIVHLYGIAAKINEIIEIAEAFDIPIIEDAAESLGVFIANKAVGTFGKMGIYSFNGNKIITTGGGGALISDSSELIEKARKLSSQAREDFWHYEHYQVGYTYRMSSLAAAIGITQLAEIESFIEKKRKIHHNYTKAILKSTGISFTNEPPNSRATWWLTVIQFDSSEYPNFPTLLHQLLEKKLNCETRPVWKPLHLQPIFRHFEYYGECNAQKVFEQGLCLPSGVGLSADTQSKIIEIINEQLYLFQNKI